MFDMDSVMFTLARLSGMTLGAAIFFSVVAWCLFFLTNRVIDIVLCAVRSVGRGIQGLSYAIGEMLFANVEDEQEVEPEPRRKRASSHGKVG